MFYVFLLIQRLNSFLIQCAILFYPCWFEEFGIRLINTHLIYLFRDSQILSARFCIDILRTNSVLVTHGGERVNVTLLWNKVISLFQSQACKESCLANNQFLQCGCMEYRFPVDKIPVCDITNKTTSKFTLLMVCFTIITF